jgi:hypothetical protein
MNETKAILAIIAGSGMIYAGFTVKQFYAAKGLCGAVLLFVGFKELFFDIYK